MKTPLLSGVAALVFFCAPFASAAEPIRELSPAVAVNLISLRSNIPTATVEIAFIIDGTVRENDFEASHIRRVAAIHPQPSLRRRLIFYDIYWNEVLGWFLWEARGEPGGDVVYLWTELQGAIVNR